MKELLQYLKKKKLSTESLKRWRNWAFRLLSKRHLIDPDICAYDKVHIVGKVQKFGGGTLFWSLACSGCQLGQQLIQLYEERKKIPTQTHCAFLYSGLLTNVPVKTGDIYHLPAR